VLKRSCSLAYGLNGCRGLLTGEGWDSGTWAPYCCIGNDEGGCEDVDATGSMAGGECSVGEESLGGTAIGVNLCGSG